MVESQRVGYNGYLQTAKAMRTVGHAQAGGQGRGPGGGAPTQVVFVLQLLVLVKALLTRCLQS